MFFRIIWILSNYWINIKELSASNKIKYVINESNKAINSIIISFKKVKGILKKILLIHSLMYKIVIIIIYY